MGGDYMSSGATKSAVAYGVRARSIRWSKLLVVLGFLVPPAVIYIWLVLLPMAQAVFYSLYRWNGLGPLQHFVGLGNYELILRDRVFISALGHNLIIVALSICIQLPLALALALLLRGGVPGRAAFRMIFFLPYVLSEVVTGVIWSFIYNPQNGLMNAVLGAVIPGFNPIGWLGDPGIVLYALFVVITWKYFGLHFILYTAGLQDIPSELEEAAEIDGASTWQKLRYVTIPLLGRTIRLSVFLSVLGSLQIFDLIWVMTTGGPVNASETMATYLYKFGFQRFAIGYGSAVAVVLFVICLAFAIFYQRQIMSRDYS